MAELNLVSVSGGKDSTATALLAAHEGLDNVRFVFADTGHEHPQTYEYVTYLSGVLKRACGQGIETVRANFDERMANKRAYIETHWPEKGVPADIVESALDVLEPSGNPFLDLCLWKGRFPSSMTRFCTQFLKHEPISTQVVDPAMHDYSAIISWQGIRADESPSRAKMPMHDVEFGQWEPERKGLLIYRPLIDWSAERVFDQHRRYGVLWNPLYEQGMGRVGCMPCIMANKSELREIAIRFPEAFEKLEKWESMVARAAKRGFANFFPPDKTPGHVRGQSDPDRDWSAESVRRWALTKRGGRVADPEAVAAVESDDPPACSSVYGLCE